MGTDKVIFVGGKWGATGSHMTGSDVTGSRTTGTEVCYAHAQRKFCNIPNGTFSLEVTQ